MDVATTAVADAVAAAEHPGPAVASAGVFSASDEYSEAGGVSGPADTAADTYTNCGDRGAPSLLLEICRGVSGGVGAANVTMLGGGSGGNDLWARREQQFSGGTLRRQTQLQVDNSTSRLPAF